MKYKPDIYMQLRSVLPILIKVYLPVLGILFVIGVFGLLDCIEVGTITRDPAQLTGCSPFLGVMSNIGILFWCSSASICFFCSVILREDGDKQNASFLFSAALVTFILMIDDYFLFHDVLFPDYLHIHEFFIYFAYVLIICVFLITYHSLILETEYIILLLAFAFFGLSISVDILARFFRFAGTFLFEDGFKFLGIVSWFTYYTRFCLQCLKPLKSQKKIIIES